MPAAPEASAPRPKVSRFRGMLRWAEHLLASVGLCFLIYHTTLESTVMTSNSMAPALQGTTYETGDHILLEKVTRWFRPPKRWEIYFYYDTEGNPVAKRVVGLPGERIAIRNHRVYINGRALERPKALRPAEYYAYGSLRDGREVDCGDGYFMLGDASIDSYDSRYTGLVSRDRFRGRVWCILWPLNRLGFVK